MSHNYRTESYTLHWRDARRARGDISSHAAFITLLADFGFSTSEVEPPFQIENEAYFLTCRLKQVGETFPCTAVLERKPQGALQETAWAYADETQMARIEEQEDELGVRFLDEDVFVPFSKLAFDQSRGFTIQDD